MFVLGVARWGIFAPYSGKSVNGKGNSERIGLIKPPSLSFSHWIRLRSIKLGQVAFWLMLRETMKEGTREYMWMKNVAMFKN